MNKRKLHNYLIKEHNECFPLGPYWLPKIIEAPRVTGMRIDLKEYREKNLLPEEISEFESNFSDMFIGIEEPGESFIQEFPIPIYDRELWIKICEDLDIYEECILNKSLLSIDFFFPYRGITIEIDGAQHWLDSVQVKDDSVRDRYLWEKYNLPVYRLHQFTFKSAWRLLQIGTYHPTKEEHFSFKDWDHDILKNWERIYYQDILALDHLDKSFKPDKLGNVVVKKFKLEDIFHEKLNNPSRINHIINLFYNLYGKKLQSL